MYQVTSSKNFSETVNSTQVVIDYKIIGDIDSITESPEFQKLEKMINQKLDNQFSVLKNKMLIDFYDNNEGFSSTSSAKPIFDVTLNEDAVFISIGFVVEGNIMENVLSAHFSIIDHFANKMISDFSKATSYQIEKEYSIVEHMSHSKESVIVFDQHEKGTEYKVNLAIFENSDISSELVEPSKIKSIGLEELTPIAQDIQGLENSRPINAYFTISTVDALEASNEAISMVQNMNDILEDTHYQVSIMSMEKVKE